MSQAVTKDTSQYTDNKEHNATYNVKNVMPYGYDGVNAVAIAVDANGNIQINNALPTAPKTGQVKVAVTGTAVQFGNNALTQGVIVCAKATNAAAVTIGPSGVTNTIDGTGNGVVIYPGSCLSYAGTNTNQLYVNGTANDIVSFIGS